MLQNQKHFLGPIGKDDRLEWTMAAQPVFDDIPNITAEIKNPFYIDLLPDGTLIVSNFGNKRIYAVDAGNMEARLFLDGSAFGMKDMGNCVVDDEGFIWVNEVEGCRVWRFNGEGQPVLTLGNGKPGFQPGQADFETVRFNIVAGKMNDSNETDPFKLNLLLISSMDYYNGRLFIPQWNTDTGFSDLIVLKESQS